MKKINIQCTWQIPIVCKAGIDWYMRVCDSRYRKVSVVLIILTGVRIKRFNFGEIKCMRFSLGQTKQFVIYVFPYRWEKCDVTWPWYQNFCISTIFLDRESHLYCQTIKEKYGLHRSVSECNRTMSYVNFFSPPPPAIFVEPRFVEIQKFFFHGKET